MSSLSRYFPQSTPQNMSQTDLSLLSNYTVTNGDSQLYYNGSTDINITLPSKTTANWNNYPIIFITNMSSSSGTKMTFNFATNVKVKAADMTNYTQHFSVRGGINGYIIYTGNDQWMLQGVGANFDGL